MYCELKMCPGKQAWDEFVLRSPQGNVFCRSSFLDAYGIDYELLLVQSEGVPVLGVPVFLRGGAPAKAPLPYAMYQGPLFAPEVGALPCHSRIVHGLRLTQFLLDELERRHGRISFCLHHQFTDLRSFSWFHYHERALGQFQIDLRYTGLLDLSRINNFADYLGDIRPLRRRELRKAAGGGWAVENSTDLDLLDRLHRLTFERQGISRPESEGGLLRSIARAALEAGCGEMLVGKNRSGTVAGATLFLWDHRHSYYLVGANDPEYRATGCSTQLMVENIRRAKDRDLRAVDFVGVNSPDRGDYKISYNAEPVPYFIVTWEKPA